jgi:hypothetical protein
MKNLAIATVLGLAASTLPLGCGPSSSLPPEEQVKILKGDVESTIETCKSKYPSNAGEFKKLLLHDLDAFNHTFIDKLATYGLRRSMSFSDRDELKKIAAVSKAKDYRLRDLIEAFVTSDLFQSR